MIIFWSIKRTIAASLLKRIELGAYLEEENA